MYGFEQLLLRPLASNYRTDDSHGNDIEIAAANSTSATLLNNNPSPAKTDDESFGRQQILR